MGIVKLFKGIGAIDAMKTTSIWNAWSHKFQRHFAGFKSYYHCYCCAQLLSHMGLFVTPWTVAHQVSLSMGFSKQEYQNDTPFPTQGIFWDQGLNLCPLHLLHWQVGKLVSNHTIKSLLWKFLRTAEKKKSRFSKFKNWVKFLLIWWNLILKNRN